MDEIENEVMERERERDREAAASKQRHFFLMGHNMWNEP